MDPKSSREGFQQDIMAKATERWGPERAEANKDMIHDVARCLWLVSQSPPPLEEEPGFFLLRL